MLSKKLIYLSIIILMISFTKIINAQDSNIDSIINKGIKQIYNIQFDEAEKTFRSLIADYPENPAGRFFLAMVDWWRILLDLDNESYDNIFFQKLEDVIYQCNQILKNDKDNVEALFFKGGSIGFRGRLRSIRGNWLKAVDDAIEALPIVQKAAKLDPSNLDVQLGFGIYDYYASVIPDKYPYIKPVMIFFPKGDKEKGLQQLTNTAMNGKYAKYESQYFLMTSYYEYEIDLTNAEKYATMLVNEFPNNPVFERWNGRIAVRRGDLYNYFNIFSDVYKKVLENYPGYNNKNKREATYYLGLYYKTINQPDSAIKYFKICETISESIDLKEESGFLVNSILYLGMLNDIIGEREVAIQYYNRILEMKNYQNSKDLAKSFLNNPYKNN
ncbi:MAG: hypothetical protein STSR0008_08420 [Ignavibacterium sp.]